MEISAKKTKLMTNSANGIQREMKVKEQKLGTVTSFKYLGAVVSDGGSKPEILSRIAQATAALTKAEAHLERFQCISWIRGEADMLPCHFHISVCLLIMDLDCRVREKNSCPLK